METTENPTISQPSADAKLRELLNLSPEAPMEDILSAVDEIRGERDSLKEAQEAMIQKEIEAKLSPFGLDEDEKFFFAEMLRNNPAMADKLLAKLTKAEPVENSDSPANEPDGNTEDEELSFEGAWDKADKLLAKKSPEPESSEEAAEAPAEAPAPTVAEEPENAEIEAEANPSEAVEAAPAVEVSNEEPPVPVHNPEGTNGRLTPEEIAKEISKRAREIQAKDKLTFSEAYGRARKEIEKEQSGL